MKTSFDRFIAVCVLAMATLFLGAADKLTGLPSETMGSWSGKGTQLFEEADGAQTYSTWRVDLTLNGTSAQVKYPSFNCGGTWAQEGATEHDVTYRETITYGFAECIDQGKVVVSRVGDGRLRVEYYFPDEKFIAIAYLARG